MIADSLAGKRIAVTGSTGFLGTALVEKLLRSVPDCELVLLVRPTRRYSVERRVNREILRNDAFNLLRAQWGSEFEQRCEKRIQVVAGDVSQDGLGLSDADNETFTSCDVIIHSAATVSFDNPLDTSIEINLLGPNRIIEALHRSRDAPDNRNSRNRTLPVYQPCHDCLGAFHRVAHPAMCFVQHKIKC